MTALLLHALLMLVATAALLLASPAPQRLHELRALLRKTPALTATATAVLRSASALRLALAAVAALLVPSFALGMATAPMADLVVIAALLAADRAVAVLAALDTGTAPVGLAAAAALRGLDLTLPALLLAALAVASAAGATNLATALATVREAPPAALLLAGLALGALTQAAQAEPDPAAPELSGALLAAAQVADALRLAVWLSLAAALLLPMTLAPREAGLGAWAAGVAFWLAKMVVLGALLWGGRLLGVPAAASRRAALLLAGLAVLAGLAGPGAA